jgi:DNA-binding Xre family transcriptional regulator
MAWRIDEYRTAAGETPVRTFIADLSPDAKAEAIALIKLAETLGNKLRGPHSKALGDGLFELRRDQVRLFSVEEGEDREEEVMAMARKSEFMRWIDHQVETDADLKRKVEEYLNEMMIEQKLTALRNQRGMTQAQLAERLGVSQSHIAKLEAGHAKNIELRTLCRWATALGAKLAVDVFPTGARKRKQTAA